MPPVPYCNLSDIYTDYNAVTNPKNTINTSNDSRKNLMKYNGNSQAKTNTQNQQPNQQPNQQQNQFEYTYNKSPSELYNQQLPELNTFTNAVECSQRNQQFQNKINNQYTHNLLQEYPKSHEYMYPNNTLPIAQDPNLWPKQYWTMNPSGPEPNYDTYFWKNRSYFQNYPLLNYNQWANKLDLNPNNTKEYFGNDSNNNHEIEKILTYILYILMIILIIHIHNLFKN